ncbi:GntR family transcriptional regulator, partial [bacterium]|nr:GntR family transcriptional regulator [bacterium]
ISGNVSLLKILENLHLISKSFRIYQTKNQVPKRDFNPYTHSQILDAIKNKDKERAKKIMYSHIAWAKNYILKNFRNNKRR